MTICLTVRECEVLAVLRAHPSRSNKEIGWDLHISFCTVKSHLRTMYIKFGVNNRIDLVIRANQQVTESTVLAYAATA